jgi:WD40 repeat protein
MDMKTLARAVSGTAAVALIACLCPAASALAHSARAGTGVQAGQVGGFRDRPQHVVFSPDGKVLATADSDGTARLWNVATQKQIGAPIRVGGTKVKNVAYSPDGTVLALAAADGQVWLWNVKTRHRVGGPFTVGRLKVINVAISPNGKLLAAAGGGRTIRLWNIATHRQDGRPLTVPTDQFSVHLTSVQFSPDSKLLLTTQSDGVGRLWSVASHRQAGKPIGNPKDGPLNSVVFSSNGKLIGVAAARGESVWNVATRKQVGTSMRAGISDSFGVAFTPDGKTLVTDYVDATVRQWSVATDKQIRPAIVLKGYHPFNVEAISPNGKILATTVLNNNALLWNLSKA